MSDNKHLLKIADGSEDFTFTVDATNYVPMTGTSGHVPEGIYELKCSKVEAVKSKAGNPMVRFFWQTAAPAPFVGVPIRSQHIVPRVDLTKDSEKIDKFWSGIVASLASAKGGKVEIPKKELTLHASNFLGKTAYAELETTFNDGNEYSDIKYFVMKDEFDMRPGPHGGGAAASTPSTETATTAEKPATDETPDVMAGKSSVEDSLGLGGRGDDAPPAASEDNTPSPF